MPPLPTMSLRAPPEHHALIREVARALRDAPATEAALRDLLRGGAAPLPDDVLRRLAAVEAGHAGLLARLAELEAGRKPKAAPLRIAIPDATHRSAERDPRQTDLEDFTGPPAPRRSFADALKAEMAAAGMTRSTLAERLAVTPQGVGKWMRGFGMTTENRRALLALFPNLRGVE